MMKHVLFKKFNSTNVKGMFTYVLSKNLKSTSISSNIAINNLINLVDLSKSETGITCESKNDPIEFFFDLGNFRVIVNEYLLNGRYDSRMMKTWKISGRNFADEKWSMIDYKTALHYCTMSGDVCLDENDYFVKCNETSGPYRYIKFEMIEDMHNNTEDLRFRLKRFEIYGYLIKGSSFTCNHKHNIVMLSL